MKPYVFVARPIPGQAIHRLRDIADVHIWPEQSSPPASVLQAEAARAEALIVLLTDKVDRPLLDAAERLRIVSNVAVGVDNIDVAACTDRGIPVGHTPDVLTETTADLTFALLMAAARQVVQADAFVRAGHWKRWDPLLFLGKDIHGSTLGIIGLGKIGRAVARRAQGFGMRILYSHHRDVDPGPGLQGTQVPLETLLTESDFVSVHVPLNGQTHHLINRDAIQRMKPGAILINAARGPVVETDALVEALKDGHLGAAGLDVTDPEPLPMGHPLMSLSNVVLAPHIGSASSATREKMADLAVENVYAVLQGKPPVRCVNPQVLSARPNAASV